MIKSIFGPVIVVALLLGLAGCGQGAPTVPPDTRTPASTVIAPATAIAPVPTPTAWPTATATAAPTYLPTATVTPLPTLASAPAGQIVFGAYPCGSGKSECGPYPGVAQDFALYSINSDGTDMRPLTGEELRARELLVRLPFVPAELVQQAEEAGHFERYISALELFASAAISWLPDGSAWLEPGKDGLYLIQADGTGATRLVAGEFSYYELRYALSPDGKFVAYARVEENGIYVTEVAGAASRQVAQLQLPARTRTTVLWAPTGERILLFIHSNPAELYLLDNLTGETPQVQLLFRAADDEGLFSPQWVPAGQTIYFVLCQERYTSFIIGFNVPRREQQQIAHLTGLGGCITDMAWSPSRTHVVLAPSFIYSGDYGFYVFNLETERYQQILYRYVPDGPLIWLPEAQD